MIQDTELAKGAIPVSPPGHHSHQQPGPSKLKDALDEALLYAGVLRHLLTAHNLETNRSAATEMQGVAATSSRYPSANVTTQTDLPSTAMPRATSAAHFPSMATPRTQPNGARDHLFGTPGCTTATSTPVRAGVVEAAVQQACRSLLTPQPTSAGKVLASRPGGYAPQNTPIPVNVARTPVATGHAYELHSSQADSPLSDFALAPFSAYQRVQKTQEVRRRALPDSTAPTRNAANAESTSREGDLPPAGAELQKGVASHGAGPLSRTTDSAVPLEVCVAAPVVAPQVVSYAAPASAAAVQPVEPSFTPNTTTVRLRAAMQWMQLQLQVSPGRMSRPRRYSDSSVSPALKILAPSGEAAASPLALVTAAQDAAAMADPTACGGLFDHWGVEAPAAEPPALTYWRSPAALSGTGTAAVDQGVATAPMAPSSAVVQQDDPARSGWPQPLIWQSVSSIPAGTGSPTEGSWLTAAGSSRSQGHVTQPSLGWSSAVGPLHDISGKICNAGSPKRCGQEHSKRISVQSHGPSGASEEGSEDLSQKRRGSGLRFVLPW